MNFKDQDIISGSLLVLASLLGYFYAWQMENLAVAGLSSAFFPSLCFTVMLVCGLILIKQGVQRGKKNPFPSIKWGKILPVIALLAGYVILMEYAGFIISSIVFLVCSICFFGERRKKILVAAPIVATGVVYYLFTQAFMIILP